MRKGRTRALGTTIVVAGLLAATMAAPIATANDGTGTPIVYSGTYVRYIALFPGGYASNGCVLALALSGERGVCTTEWYPVWFYPDGTTGPRAWRIDPSSPVGWSVEPDPCALAFVGTDPDIDWWPLYIGYLDWLLGLTSTRPEGITDLQGGCLIQIYGY